MTISHLVNTLPGKFIELDGPDGSGKETQTTMLYYRLQSLGVDVMKISFPRYGQPSAVMVERYLQGDFGPATEVDPRHASVLFAEDRKAATPEILEALKAGKVVLTDRFVTANLGHQGSKISDLNERAEYFQWTLHLEHEIFGIPRPDLTFIVWARPDVLLPRLERKKAERPEGQVDGLEDSTEHIRAAAMNYKRIATTFRDVGLPIEFLDFSEDTIENAFERLWIVLESRFRSS
jgi:dTMP kinase